jgi:predicted nucleic acid-binding Zn ribbon protein
MSDLPSTLDLLLSHLGYRRRHPALWAMVRWREVAGEMVARHALPEAVHGGTLTVVVDSAGWAQELRFLEAGLIRRLNEAAGRHCVDALRYRIGTLPGGEPYRVSGQRGMTRSAVGVAVPSGWTMPSDGELAAAWRRLLAAGFDRCEREGEPT